MIHLILELSVSQTTHCLSKITKPFENVWIYQLKHEIALEALECNE